MWPAYSHSILLDGAWASGRRMDAWGTRHGSPQLTEFSHPTEFSHQTGLVLFF